MDILHSSFLGVLAAYLGVFLVVSVWLCRCVMLSLFILVRVVLLLLGLVGYFGVGVGLDCLVWGCKMGSKMGVKNRGKWSLGMGVLQN